MNVKKVDHTIKNLGQIHILIKLKLITFKHITADIDIPQKEKESRIH